jgi:hypothetical protein
LSSINAEILGMNPNFFETNKKYTKIKIKLYNAPINADTLEMRGSGRRRTYI